jgi:hypothetical protein
MKKEIRILLDAVISKGIYSGVEFLLTKKDSLSFIELLLKQNILMSGCDVWDILEIEGNRYYSEVVGGGTWIPKENDVINYSVKESGITLKNYIIENVDEKNQLVSLLFNDQDIDAYITSQKNSRK